MRLYYIINARIPTEKAHGIQVMKMCEAFAREGNDVTLVVPKRCNTIKTDPFVYYGVEQNFTIEYIPILGIKKWHTTNTFFLGTFIFTLITRIFLSREKGEAVLYTRGETPIFLSILLPKRFKLFWETHIKPGRIGLYRNVLKNSMGIIVITKYYKDELVDVYNINSNKILSAPDAVDIDMFDININKNDARKKLLLPQDKYILISTSSAIKWKGTHLLENIAKLLPAEYKVVFVGIDRKDGDVPGVEYVGKKPYSEIPMWLKAADILLLPGDPMSSTASFYTSPLKMFEYMASKRPIVAFDLPSFRDILTEHNALFIDPTNAHNASEKIKNYINNKQGIERIAHKAFSDVAKYTWSIRAKNILSFIKKRG